MAGKWVKKITGKMKNYADKKKKTSAPKGDLKSAVKKSGKLGKKAQVAAKAKKDS